MCWTSDGGVAVWEVRRVRIILQRQVEFAGIKGCRPVRGLVENSAGLIADKQDDAILPLLSERELEHAREPFVIGPVRQPARVPRGQGADFTIHRR